MSYDEYQASFKATKETEDFVGDLKGIYRLQDVIDICKAYKCDAKLAGTGPKVYKGWVKADGTYEVYD